MYCERLEKELTDKECAEIQDNECSVCEYYHHFIWFLLANKNRSYRQKHLLLSDNLCYTIKNKYREGLKCHAEMERGQEDYLRFS